MRTILRGILSAVAGTSLGAVVGLLIGGVIALVLRVYPIPVLVKGSLVGALVGAVLWGTDRGPIVWAAAGGVAGVCVYVIGLAVCVTGADASTLLVHLFVCWVLGAATAGAVGGLMGRRKVRTKPHAVLVRSTGGAATMVVLVTLALAAGGELLVYSAISGSMFLFAPLLAIIGALTAVVVGAVSDAVRRREAVTQSHPPNTGLP